jgi:uncharacterized membrane protein (DUF2068 family)
MSGERGQASIELVVGALGLALAALAIVQLLLIAGARQRALDVAGRVAVLRAEGRPVPDRLRRDAHIELRGDVVRVTVKATGLPALPPFQVREQAVVP